MATDQSIADLDAQIRDAEQLTASTSDEASNVIVMQERSAMRSHATKVVIWLYALIMCAMVVYIMSVGALTGDFKSAEAQLVDLIKTAVIPIVTFVVGHYFGSSSR